MKTRYGLRALGTLAREYGNGPQLASDISIQEGIPRRFLIFILHQLRREGILRSKRGKGGGYLLSRTPSSISLGDLVRALDGPLHLLECATPEDGHTCKECPVAEPCAIRTAFREASQAITNVLDRITLADIAAAEMKRTVAAMKPHGPRENGGIGK